ncbi:MAG TPA: hypothetical protein VGZ22_12035 [Isosphaeraceae bacterium]|jgi:hypothetical protein|nr:hypothetical protein [Isosphaeraceae bacterium]
MGPAEVVASLKELCVDEGPRLSTERLVKWIERHGGFESNAVLVAYAKKMKARQYARMLMYDDEETGLRIKQLWSCRDRDTGQHYYVDITSLPPERRRKLIQQYAKFLEQLRSVRRAMADYFAGQQFFDFYTGRLDMEAAQAMRKRERAAARQKPRARKAPARRGK